MVGGDVGQPHDGGDQAVLRPRHPRRYCRLLELLANCGNSAAGRCGLQASGLQEMLLPILH